MSFHFKSYSESTPAVGRAGLNTDPTGDGTDGVSSTTGGGVGQSGSQLPISIPEESSNGIIRIHSDSQQSLDRLFNPAQSGNSVPLRQRNLPSSFFNPTPVSNLSSNTNVASYQNKHCRSTSYNFMNGAPTIHEARSNTNLHMKTHSALVTPVACNSNNHITHINGNEGMMKSLGSQSSDLAASCSNQSLNHMSPRLVSQNNLNSSELHTRSNQQLATASTNQHIQQQQQQPANIINQTSVNNHYRNYSSPTFIVHSRPLTGPKTQTSVTAGSNMIGAPMDNQHQARGVITSDQNNHFNNHNGPNRRDQSMRPLGLNQCQSVFDQQTNNEHTNDGYMDTRTAHFNSLTESMDTGSFGDEQNPRSVDATFEIDQRPCPTATFNGGNNQLPVTLHYNQYNQPLHQHQHSHQPQHHPPNQQTTLNQPVNQQPLGHVVVQQQKYQIAHSYSQQHPMQHHQQRVYQPEPFESSTQHCSRVPITMNQQQSTVNMYPTNNSAQSWNHANVTHCHNVQQTYISPTDPVMHGYTNETEHWTSTNANYVKIAQKF